MKGWTNLLLILGGILLISANAIRTLAAEGTRKEVPLSAQEGGPWATVLFANKVPPPGVDARVFGADGKSGVEGEAYHAQLYVRGVAVTPAAPFGRGDLAGYWQAEDPVVFLTNVAPGSVVGVKVQVWQSPNGETLQEAIDLGLRHKATPVFQVITGATASSPGLLFGLPSVTFGYGQIRFTNRTENGLDARVFGPDGDYLEGPRYVTQLIRAAVPATPPVPFGMGPDAGYWLPDGFEFITVTNQVPGDVVRLKLRIWNIEAHPIFTDAPKDERLEVDFLYTLGGGLAPTEPAYGGHGLSLAPSTILFRNGPPGPWDLPVLTEASRLSGTNFVAQLWIGGVWSPLQPASPNAPFGEGSLAGYWQPADDGIVVITNTSPGEVVRGEVRVWDLRLGRTWEEASLDPNASRRSPITFRVGAGTRHPGVFISPPRISFQSGGVDFRNFVPGLLDQPVHDAVGQLLTGPDYVAQLRVLNLSGEVLVTSQPAPFGQGAQAGYWQPGANSTIRVPGLRPDDPVRYEIRIWNRAEADVFESATGFKQSLEGTTVLGGLGNERPTLLRRNLPMSIAPGTLDFRNRIPGILDRPIRGPDGGPLTGTNFVAQLYLRDQPGDSPRRAVGIPRPFGEGAEAGYWTATPNPILFLDGVLAGEARIAEVAVWDITTAPTFELATGPRARSAPFPLVTGISGVTPPGLLDSFAPIDLQQSPPPIRLSPGMHLVGYPYAAGTLYPYALLPGGPPGASIHLYQNDLQSYWSTVYADGTWDWPFLPWSGGEVAFVFNPGPEPLELEFRGGAGQQPRLNRTPGTVSLLAITCTDFRGCDFDGLIAGGARDGDIVYRWRNGGWTLAGHEFGAWDDLSPRLAYGEACFVRLLPSR